MMQENRFSIKAITAGVCILVMLGCCCFVVLRWMLSDLNVRSVQNTLSTWAEAEQASSLADWSTAFQTLSEAQNLKPKDPLPFLLEGLLYEWRGFAINGEEISAADILSSRRYVVDAYWDAAELQPASADNWARLARAKVFSGELDDDFRLAVERAIKLGTNIRPVQQQVLQAASLSIDYWQDRPELKSQICTFITRDEDREFLSGGCGE